MEDGKPRSNTTANAVLADPLVAKFDIAIPNCPGATARSWVLDMDYENYSIVWHCHSSLKRQKAGEHGGVRR